MSTADDHRRSRRRATHALFAASALFVPVPLFALFVAGLVPLWCTTALFLRAMAADDGTGGAADFLFVLAAHVAIDGGILYVMAAVVAVLLRVELTASFFPIFCSGKGAGECSSLWARLRQ